MRSKLQKASTHCNWVVRMLNGAMGISSWFYREDADYISENTMLKWIVIKDQIDGLVEDLKKDYKEYKARQR